MTDSEAIRILCSRAKVVGSYTETKIGCELVWWPFAYNKSTWKNML